MLRATPSTKRTKSWWKVDHTNTGSRGSSQLFDTPFLVEFPADLLPGDYELRLIVYDTASLKPTVTLGLWEAGSDVGPHSAGRTISWRPYRWETVLEEAPYL